MDQVGSLSLKVNKLVKKFSRAPVYFITMAFRWEKGEMLFFQDVIPR